MASSRLTSEIGKASGTALENVEEDFENFELDPDSDLNNNSSLNVSTKSDGFSGRGWHTVGGSRKPASLQARGRGRFLNK